MARLLWHHENTMSIGGATKKRGRPATGKGEPVNVRLQPEHLTALDAWITRQPEPKPSRPEAIRALVGMALETIAADEAHLHATLSEPGSR